MVYILRKFILAERIGDWDLHLQTLHEMLPFMAAAGHTHYTKSLVLYLDQMSSLSETHPDVYEAFKEGLHPVRRSDREWAGLWTDLVIEQELMLSLKTIGGLTRGSRMSEHQRPIWVMSRPACAQANISMQHLTGVHHNSSEQTTDLSDARQHRDFKDLNTIKLFFEERNPFVIPEGLVSISTGMHAGNWN